MRILITGAAGFIGSRLAEALLGHGHEVVGIDNLSTGRRENFPDGGRFLEGDIRVQDGMQVGPLDVIYHAAASYKDRSDWESDASTNVNGTINVIREAQRTGAKLIYFQTSLCYGPHPVSPILTTHPLDPHGSYAISKTAGEAYIRDWSRESGIPYVSLRLANMYGPRNLSGPVPAFYKRLMEGKPCTVVDRRRDFVYVDDLIWVAVKAAEQGQGVYNVASGSDQSIMDIYATVARVMALDAPEPVLQPRGPDDVATILLDPSRTEVEFGWKAMTPLDTGIARAVTWYRDNGVTNLYTHLSTKG